MAEAYFLIIMNSNILKSGVANPHDNLHDQTASVTSPMRSRTPLVTLGMPVYNEGKFIAESIDNLLKQTYPNLEIIIADNGSTDGSSEICAAYAAKHPNIKHIRHPKNLGQHANFNYLPRCSSGKYFCWVSAHDLLDDEFIERSVAVLESDPHIVLAYPRTMNMKADGTYTREKARPFDIRHMTPGRRFREVMWRVDCNYVYGTWRLQTMLDSQLFQVVPACDRVFLAEMAIKGTFAPVDVFKYYRMNREGRQTEIEKRHRLMSYLHPHRTCTDAELSGNNFYLPTRHAFARVVQDAHFPTLTRWYLYFSVWLAGVMKSHIFPGADTLSFVVKSVLPGSVLRRVMAKMQ